MKRPVTRERVQPPWRLPSQAHLQLVGVEARVEPHAVDLGHDLVVRRAAAA
jgi:hypothetical protein